MMLTLIITREACLHLYLRKADVVGQIANHYDDMRDYLVRSTKHKRAEYPFFKLFTPGKLTRPYIIACLT